MAFAEPRKAVNAGPVAEQRVFASAAAATAIHRLRARHGHLTLHHDGEDGGLVHRRAERPLHAGRHEACIGIACGVPFFVDYERNAELGYPDFEVDVVPPGPDAGAGAEPRLISRPIPKRRARR